MKNQNLTIVYRKPSELKDNPRNSRTHDENQIESIARSINLYGFVNPVLIDEEDLIIAGHGRRMAAIKIGMEEVPTIRLTGLSDAEKRAYMIADNKIALDSGWNVEMLESELQEITDIGLALEDTGFTLEEIDELKMSDAEEVEVEQPKKKKKKKKKPSGGEEVEEKFQILISFSTEKEQSKWLKDLTAKNLNCKSLIS